MMTIHRLCDNHVRPCSTQLKKVGHKLGGILTNATYGRYGKMQFQRVDARQDKVTYDRVCNM